MAKIEPTQTPLLYAVRYQTNVLFSGTLNKGQALATMLELISAEDDNTFLAAAVGKAGNYQPLPGVGAPLKAGEIYGLAGGLVIVRQTHTRTANDPAAVPALFSVYRVGQSGVLDWVANEAVAVGTKRKYGAVVYEAVQQHTTQTDWRPDLTPALWRVYVLATQTGAWAYPVAYRVNDQVTHGGFTYKCLQAHSSQAEWSPPVVPALWLKL